MKFGLMIENLSRPGEGIYRFHYPQMYPFGSSAGHKKKSAYPNTSDQLVALDLREADVRAGYWVDEDPPLPSIQAWIQLEL